MAENRVEITVRRSRHVHDHRNRGTYFWDVGLQSEGHDLCQGSGGLIESTVSNSDHTANTGTIGITEVTI